MPIRENGTLIKKAVVNGATKKTVVINGLTVFKSQLPFIFRDGTWNADHALGSFSVKSGKLGAILSVNSNNTPANASPAWVEVDCTDAQTVTLRYSMTVSGTYNSVTGATIKLQNASGTMAQSANVSMGGDSEDPESKSGMITLNVAALTGVQRLYIHASAACRTGELVWSGRADVQITEIGITYGG